MAKLDLIGRAALQRTMKRTPSKLIGGKQYINLSTVLEKLRKAPSVDAVPVVRCRECKAWERGLCRLLCADTEEDGYCYWGERKGDEHD